MIHDTINPTINPSVCGCWTLETVCVPVLTVPSFGRTATNRPIKMPIKTACFGRTGTSKRWILCIPSLFLSSPNNVDTHRTATLAHDPKAQECAKRSFPQANFLGDEWVDADNKPSSSGAA